jgi:drug/metabolite transporter (DMT)-like permease
LRRCDPSIDEVRRTTREYRATGRNRRPCVARIHTTSDPRRQYRQVVVAAPKRLLGEGDKAALTIVSMGLLWGSMGVVIRQVDVPAVAIVWSRLVFAAPALAWFVRRHDLSRWSWRPSRLVLLNGLILAVHWTTFVAALQRAPIGTVLLITYLAPVGIAALAPRVLGERLGIRLVVALVLGVGGVALIAAPSMNGSTGDGVILAVITGCVYVALALLNKHLADEFGGACLALWQVLIAGALLTPLALIADWGPADLSWLWLPVLGVVYTAVAFGAYLTALAKVPASRAVILLYLEPAGAVAFGWLLLHEHPSLLTCVGGLAIVAGGLLVLRSPADQIVANTPPVTQPTTS